MGNLGKLFMLYTILQLITISKTNATIGIIPGTPSPILPVETWFRNINLLPQRAIKFTLFAQEILGGPEQNTYEVARASITSTSSTSFGLVQVADGKLTTGPEPNSPVVGRFQGLIASPDLQQPALFLNLVDVFTSGPYNGSTIDVFGRTPLVNQTSELSIIGGTGVFRMARGIIVVTPISPLNAIVSVFRTDYYIIYPSSR